MDIFLRLGSHNSKDPLPCQETRQYAFMYASRIIVLRITILIVVVPYLVGRQPPHFADAALISHRGRNYAACVTFGVYFDVQLAGVDPLITAPHRRLELEEPRRGSSRD